MMNQFSKILITHKPDADSGTMDVVNCVRAYADYRKVPVIEYPEGLEDNVLIVSVGGDGTMLNAMRLSTHYEDSTVVGFNTGTLGFLTEEVPEKLFLYLDNIMFENNVVAESRMLLEGTLIVDGIVQKGMSFVAANEFVLTATIDAPLVTDIYINEKFVTSQLGSGVLVSSSTGSTAMSLSAGGAIVSPSTNIMQIVPLLSHTLTSRPIITTGRDEINVYTELTERVPTVSIHADGKPIFESTHEIGTDIGISVAKHPKDVLVWRPKDWNFFEVLTKKMKW